jgi:hypothetical protein
MDERAKAAFASVSDTSKQLITLATGILGLEITFSKDIIGSDICYTYLRILGSSWVCFLLSIVAGVWLLLAVTGTLGKGAMPTSETTYQTNIRIPAFIQILFFLVGLVLSVWFGMQSFGKT